jgi:hypothetical protein
MPYLIPLHLFVALPSSCSGQLFQADNITLVVSRADFAALLSAALRGSRWKTGASATLPLFSQIATFSVSPDSPPTRSAITLSAYNGWGLNATNIIFLPQGGPLLASDPLPDQCEWQTCEGVLCTMYSAVAVHPDIIADLYHHSSWLKL